MQPGESHAVNDEASEQPAFSLEANQTMIFCWSAISDSGQCGVNSVALTEPIPRLYSLLHSDHLDVFGPSSGPQTATAI